MIDLKETSRATLIKATPEQQRLAKLLKAVETTVSGREALLVKCRSTASDPICVTEGIFWGTLGHTTDDDVLSRLGITHILDCSASTLYKNILEAQISPNLINLGEPRNYYHLISARAGGKDSGCTAALSNLRLEHAISYINSVKAAHGTLLVCCISGVNRSAAVCTAYLMANQKQTLLTALKNIRDKMGQIIQIQELQMQLIRFAEIRGLIDSVNAWPREETDSDLEIDLFDEWRSLDSFELRGDDADYSQERKYSEEADDGLL